MIGHDGKRRRTPAELGALVEVEGGQRRARQLQRLHAGAARQAHVPQAARRQIHVLQCAAPLQTQIPGSTIMHSVGMHAADLITNRPRSI